MKGFPAKKQHLEFSLNFNLLKGKGCFIFKIINILYNPFYVFSIKHKCQRAFNQVQQRSTITKLFLSREKQPISSLLWLPSGWRAPSHPTPYVSSNNTPYVSSGVERADEPQHGWLAKANLSHRVGRPAQLSATITITKI